MGLPRWLSGKESTCQWRRCRRCTFDPLVGNILWRRDGNTLQYSCLENSMVRGVWQAIARRVTESQTWLSVWVHTYVEFIQFKMCARLYSVHWSRARIAWRSSQHHSASYPCSWSPDSSRINLLTCYAINLSALGQKWGSSYIYPQFRKGTQESFREEMIFELDSKRSVRAYAVEMAERDLPGIGKYWQWQKVPVEHGVFWWFKSSGLACMGTGSDITWNASSNSLVNFSCIKARVKKLLPRKWGPKRDL